MLGTEVTVFNFGIDTYPISNTKYIHMPYTFTQNYKAALYNSFRGLVFLLQPEHKVRGICTCDRYQVDAQKKNALDLRYFKFV